MQYLKKTKMYISHVNEVQNTAIRKKPYAGLTFYFKWVLDFGETFALSLEYCARL